MKKGNAFVLILSVVLAVLLCACTPKPAAPETTGTSTSCVQAHIDTDADGSCDRCGENVVVIFDIYAVNDLHGKIADADTHPGVDELTTYIKDAREANPNTILLSVGDMWQGSSESNLTGGLLTTHWMNEIDFAAMTMGNHEYDWGEAPIEENAALAEFPFLAINIYDRATNAQVDYCQSSVVVDQAGIQIGIIGAIGDCYSSIAGDKVEDVYFITGNALTDLVKKEAVRLRAEGVDFIIYALHDGYGQSTSASATTVSDAKLRSYYDTALSGGYVDLVFEGHTHQRYLLRDAYGVYHLQNSGDNKGISHVELSFNIANDTSSVDSAELIATGTYARMEDDPIVGQLLEVYAEQIAPAAKILGNNARERNRNELRQLGAELYYQAGVETWGEEYDIVLGGGFFSVRSPGSLKQGEVTYGMLQSLFPFDNQLVLCSIRGSDLVARFFESDNSNYFISYGEYGAWVKENIDPDGVYYVIVDSYSSTYAPNRLTEIARMDENLFLRDLLAAYIENGGLE